ncbi:hypothetical protein [Alkaliphilus sp. B6464]|uniref:hypothetical protein n=1 Tax=Alkaliphilus sp. B6464 TaxID=2731219 RepID=UPI001BA93127|nr:hypothetical protein [Alkaliphilus sp. B6464]QUH22109.1 hypothetical protein HYG84_19575 [Alkaliphilus sp. B6464]
MKVRKLNIKDLNSVSKLESEIYPEEFRLGYYDYLHDFKTYENYSCGVFKDNKLIGYVIIYKDGSSYYISDLVCMKPLELMTLLLVAFNNIDSDSIFAAELRSNSYKLLKNISRKFKEAINFIKDIKMPKYYHGEDGYDVLFRLNFKKISNPKYKILTCIYENNDFVTYDTIFSNLKKMYNFTQKDIERYKSFIFKHSLSFNLSLLNIK